MPEPILPVDPLADIVFLRIPERLVSSLSLFIDPEIPIPLEDQPENPTKNPASPEITIPAMISGMIRVLIYNPDHEHAHYYRTLVKELRPDIKDDFTKAGTVKAQLKDFDVAVEIFQGLTSLFPDCPVCALNLALVFHDAALSCKDDTERSAAFNERAFHAYRAALAGENVLAETHLNYGYFLLEQENFDKALAHFRYFLDAEENDEKKTVVKKIVPRLEEIAVSDSLFKEAFDHIALGNEEKGIARAEELVRAHPDFWNGWFLLGWGQRRLGRYAEAKQSFEKALSLDKPKPDILNELAIAHMELGELPESYRRLVEAIGLEPENVKVLSNLGIVSIKMNRIEDARGFFRTVLEYDPDDKIALQFLDEL